MVLYGKVCFCILGRVLIEALAPSTCIALFSDWTSFLYAIPAEASSCSVLLLARVQDPQGSNWKLVVGVQNPSTFHWIRVQKDFRLLPSSLSSVVMVVFPITANQLITEHSEPDGHPACQTMVSPVKLH